MDSFSFKTFIDIFQEFGPFGIVLVLWWYDVKQIRKILEQYKDDMREMRRMYEDNVALVKDYRDLAGDLKEVVIMNTQAIVGLDKDIVKNQFCPLVRKEQHE